MVANNAGKRAVFVVCLYPFCTHFVAIAKTAGTVDKQGNSLKNRKPEIRSY